MTPRELPDWLNFDPSTSLRLVRDQSRNVRRGGTMQVIDKSDPRWMLEAVTAPMHQPDASALDAWLDSLRGGLRDFLYPDIRRRYPREYPDGFDGLDRFGGGAFDGVGQVDGLTATTVTVSGLPGALALKAGDAIGLEEGGAYGLHTIVEDATAVGGVVTVSVEPFVKLGIFSPAATARFAYPKVCMTLDSRDPVSGSHVQQVSFSAIQRIV